MLNHQNTTETSPHQFVTEASTLNLAPGNFPRTLKTNLGNGQPFVYSSREEHDGDLVAVLYRQDLGCLTLRVLND